MTGRTILAALAGAILAGGSPAQDAAMPTSVPQDPPPIVVVGPDADIVVTGPQPMLRGGLWQFRRSPTLFLGGGGSSRGFGFTTCLADGTLPATIRALAGERSTMPRGGICTALRLTVADGRIAGRRSCTHPGLRIGTSASNSKLDLSGRYDSRRMTMVFRSEDEFDGMERGGGAGWNPRRQTGQRWQAEAVRIGDCPAARRLDQRSAEEAIGQLFDARASPDDQ
jgi:hypothetical protein